MSGEDNFLARWSQRKREAKRAELEHEAEPVAEDVVTDADSVPQTGAPPVAKAEEPFDLESLPKLDDLTATTDIRAFLQKGVPEDLRNAALRKVWALDPAIRDYVSPALEYAYNWNVPGGVPGNGELAPGTDVARMVAQVFGSELERFSTEDVANVIEDVAPQSSEQRFAESAVRLSQPSDRIAEKPQEAPQNGDETPVEESRRAEPAGEQDLDTPGASQQKPRRHGGAMPQW